MGVMRISGQNDNLSRNFAPRQDAKPEAGLGPDLFNQSGIGGVRDWINNAKTAQFGL